MSNKKSKNLLQSITSLLALLMAYFLPEYNSGDAILDALISFCAFAPLVILLSATLNTRLMWQDTKAFIITGLVSLILGYASYLTDIGFLAQSASLWWHPIVTSIGIFAVSALGFSIEQVKTALEFIFDYSYKRYQNVQPGSYN